MGLIEKNGSRWERPRFSEAPCQRVSVSPRPTSLVRLCGGALLELMIVITIVIILAYCFAAVPTFDSGGTRSSFARRSFQYAQVDRSICRG